MSVRSHVPLTNPRVLVIDDDEVALKTISDLLRASGYDVRSLASPIGATQVISAHNIQAAVIDLNMPLMSGDRLVALIRSWDRIRDLPVVLISSTTSHILEVVTAQLPGVRVVKKDTILTQLAPALSGALSSVGERRESSTTTQRIQREDVLAAFLKGLAPQAQNALATFHALVQQPGTRPSALVGVLSTLRSQAQISGLVPVAQLLAAVSEVVERHVGRYTIDIQAAVAGALTFVAGLPGEKGGAATISMKASPYLAHLSRYVEAPK